jgi:hypothetical protein
MKITAVQALVLNMPMMIDGATPMAGGRARTASAGRKASTVRRSHRAKGCDMPKPRA